MTDEWTTDEEAAALHKRFDDLKRAGGGQAEFARRWGIPGGASMVSQHIKARRPIGIEAAIAYAAGFGCSVSEISPRLAKTIDRAATITEHAQAQPAQDGTITHRLSAKQTDSLSETLTSLARHLGQADPAMREPAAGLLAAIARTPDNPALLASLEALLMPAAFTNNQEKAA